MSDAYSTQGDSPAGSDIGSLVNPPAGLTAGLASIGRDKAASIEKTIDDTEKQLDRDRARTNKAYEATGIGPDQLQPWDEQKQHEKFSHEPLEAFGSLGSVVGIMAAAFTHAPMETAFGASAAAMNAIKAGDDQEYERAWAVHKDNMALVEKRHNMMRDSYSDAITLMKTNMAAGEAKLTMEAARYGDRKVQFLLENGMSEELFKMMEARNKAVEGAVKASNEITESTLKNHAYDTIAKGIDQAAEQAKTGGGEIDPTEVAGRKLAAFNRIFKTDKETPAQQIMGTFFAQHPTATAEEAAKFADEHHLIPNYGGRAGSNAELMSRTEKYETDPNSDTFGNHIASYNKAQRELTDLKKAEGTSKNAEVTKRAKQYETDPSSETKGDHKASYDKAAKEVIASLTPGEVIDDDSAKLMAEQYLAGDKTIFQNIGRGGQGPNNVVKVRRAILEEAKKENLSGMDIALRMAEYAGLTAGERTLGTRAANIEMFASETLNMIKVARQASDEVPRSEWVPVNRALQAFERNTGDPKIKAFGASLNALVNAYAKAIAGGGQATVSDKEHAREIIATADSPAQFDAVMGVIEKELSSARAAPGQVKQQFRDLAKDKDLGSIPKDIPSGGTIRYDAEGNRIK